MLEYFNYVNHFELSPCHEASIPCRMRSVYLCKEPDGGIPRPDGRLGNYGGVQLGNYSGAHNLSSMGEKPPSDPKCPLFIPGREDSAGRGGCPGQQHPRRTASPTAGRVG
jgi:hypothetical protein